VPSISNKGSPVGKTDYAGNGGSNFFEESGPPLSNNCFAVYPKCSWQYTDAQLTDPINGFNGVLGYRSEVSQIPDGTSNVILAGEKYLNPDSYYTGVDLSDNDEAVCGNDRDITRWSNLGSNQPQQPLRDTRGNTQYFCFGSAHPAGFNVVFCDGHVVLLNFSTAQPTFTSLTVRNDGNPPDGSF
jgi:prepilin-type processing-associated H-X9-DG protein